MKQLIFKLYYGSLSFTSEKLDFYNIGLSEPP